MTISKGDVFVGPSGSVVTVLKVRKASVDVTVTRNSKDKKGGPVVVTNERTVPVEIWHYFIKAYEKE